jgi:hypothetical protein
MKKRLGLMAMFGIVLTLGLVFVGCDNGSTDDEPAWYEQYATPGEYTAYSYVPITLSTGDIIEYDFYKNISDLTRDLASYGVTLTDPWVNNPSLDANIKSVMVALGCQYSVTYIGGTFIMNKYTGSGIPQIYTFDSP